MSLRLVRARRTATRVAVLGAAAVAVAVGLVAGPAQAATPSTGGATLDPPVVTAPGAWKPAVRTSWDWQLASVPKAPYRAVQMLDVDGFDATKADVAAVHAAGKKAVCYLSGGSWENWRPDAGQFPAALKGKNLDGWAGEKWLDVRDVQKASSTLARLMNARLQMCKDKGFDMVEWDNVDGYQNASGFSLKARDQLVYNQFLFNNTHAYGMSVLLKNDLDQVRQLLPYADGALDEQCFEYDECDLLVPFVQAGKPVFVAEYQRTTGFCTQANALNVNAVNFSLDLDGSTFQPCR